MSYPPGGPRRWLVVGLGNPGARYAETRHNAGFQVVDRAARALGATWQSGSGPWMEARARRDGVVHFLQKPLTFMNMSGEAVDLFRVQLGLAPEQLLIVCDDLDLPLGTIRIRRGGGHGGQKGLRSVLEFLGTQQVARMRLGIGPKTGDAVDFVLAPFTDEEQAAAAETFSRAADALIELMGASLDQVMNRYNQ